MAQTRMTHSDECWRWHPECAAARAIKECITVCIMNNCKSCATLIKEHFSLEEEQNAQVRSAGC